MNNIFLFLFLFFLGCENNQIEKIESVKNFDITKYVGKWYEIARIENSFEKNCNFVTADYSLRNDDGIDVVNKCTKDDGKEKIANGVGYFAKENNVGLLKVSFFRPFYGKYNIILLADDYSYSVVSSGEKYLWILSRSAKIDQKVLDEILIKLKTFNLKIENLIYPKQ